LPRPFFSLILAMKVRRSVAQISSSPVQSHICARRENAVSTVAHFYSPTGTGDSDPAGLPLPPMNGTSPWPPDMGFTVVTPSPGQIAIVLWHLTHAPSNAAVFVPDWPAQPWYNPARHRRFKSAAHRPDLAADTSNRAAALPRTLRVDRPTTHLPSSTSGAFAKHGYIAGFTRFG
jgi:hypothetical protein